ncbi:MAG: PIN domain-containing protein [Thermodesulfobacteriota bacterium]
MQSKIISVLILVSCTVFGGLLGIFGWGEGAGLYALLGIGVGLGIFVLMLMRTWVRMDGASLLGGSIGAVWGIILGLLLFTGVSQFVSSPEVSAAAYSFLMILFALIGIQLGAAAGRQFRRRGEGAAPSAAAVVGILDTSVIIDGRIADVCETGFLSGDLIIPQFVLQELQTIADSSESTKRTRGRRGLDILNKMQKQSSVGIIIESKDYPSMKDVDQKLIALAKETGHALLTNDFNLNKVAEVHAIKVLNVNQLANALKPIVLPGENMKVQVIKEGKEPGQGVAYLDDGTMVVIDNGRRFMGRTIEVTVTSVLQTTAGRMIFAVVKV